jgi:hypothetical protein
MFHLKAGSLNRHLTRELSDSCAGHQNCMALIQFLSSEQPCSLHWPRTPAGLSGPHPKCSEFGSGTSTPSRAIEKLSNSAQCSVDVNLIGLGSSRSGRGTKEFRLQLYWRFKFKGSRIVHFSKRRIGSMAAGDATLCGLKMGPLWGSATVTTASDTDECERCLETMIQRSKWKIIRGGAKPVDQMQVSQ